MLDLGMFEELLKWLLAVEFSVLLLINYCEDN